MQQAVAVEAESTEAPSSEAVPAAEQTTDEPHEFVFEYVPERIAESNQAVQATGESGEPGSRRLNGRIIAALLVLVVLIYSLVLISYKNSNGLPGDSQRKLAEVESTKTVGESEEPAETKPSEE